MPNKGNDSDDDAWGCTEKFYHGNNKGNTNASPMKGAFDSVPAQPSYGNERNGMNQNDSNFNTHVSSSNNFVASPDERNRNNNPVGTNQNESWGANTNANMNNNNNWNFNNNHNNSWENNNQGNHNNQKWNNSNHNNNSRNNFSNDNNHSNNDYWNNKKSNNYNSNQNNNGNWNNNFNQNNNWNSNNNNQNNNNQNSWNSFINNSSTPNWASYGHNEGTNQPLVEIDRSFYIQHPEVANLSPQEVDAIRSEHNIKIFANEVTPIMNPITSFITSSFPAHVIDTFESMGYVTPTPIQIQAWPIIYSGNNTIGIAETGSGKTVGFLMPALMHIIAQVETKGNPSTPIVLILSPTRELAQQIYDEALRYTPKYGIHTALLLGGEPAGPQIKQLNTKNVDLLIGTPGRVIDFINKGIFSCERFSMLILDEADRLLDMGFSIQIKQIEKNIRRDKQLLLFSATWNPKVESLAKELCHNTDFVRINVGRDSNNVNKNIQQRVICCDNYNHKMNSLISIIENEIIKSSAKCLIFCNTKLQTDILTNNINKMYRNIAGKIHGDVEHFVRKTTLKNFTDGRIKILIATDVASRGLDIKDIQYVINFEMPQNRCDYIHRSGRTGRAGQRGICYSFATYDLPWKGQLVDYLKNNNDYIPPQLME